MNDEPRSGGDGGSSLRALLLTDIVDSTRIAEQLGDAAMSSLWAAHDRAARDLLKRWRGREIDRSDGFLLLFDTVADAVGYALDYHVALGALTTPMQARAGLHFGAVRLRGNDAADVAMGAKPLEVDGLAKALAGRVMALAQPGQTLLTWSARDHLGATTHRLQSHGHWRLKGVAEPIELFEVGDESAVFTPPPDAAKAYRVVAQGGAWLPLRDVRHSLPGERDEFVGRQDALRELSQRFESGQRLVSLLGVGGCGKTRLATHFARTWLGDFPGGCWFCDLSQARDVDGIVAAVARGMNVPLGKDEPVQQLGNAIAGHGECLLILDNFEQVARHAEETLGQWLDRAPTACFLVTTREVLGIAGEQTMALAPLGQTDAEALFVQRALAAKGALDPGEDDRAAIGPLVSLLDCLPLAIELCAARVRIMPPRLLLGRMGERFRLLTSGGGRRDRQATLRAALDWSWDLLTPHEKSALAQLSVFEGGFTLEAAEAVLDWSGNDGAPWAPDVVQSLADKSFVVVQPGQQRFSLLVSVQEYAADQLRSAWPDMVASVRSRHCRWFAALDEGAATAHACADLANLVAACRASVQDGDTQSAVGALRGAWAALLLRGPCRLGLELADLVKDLPGLTDGDRVWIAWVQGSALRAVGRSRDAEAALMTALALARDCGNRTCEARSLLGLGDIDTGTGRLGKARGRLEEALELARTIGDPALECEALNALGTLHDLEGEVDAAGRCFRSTFQLAHHTRHRRWEGGALGNLGMWYANQGRLSEAREHFDASLQAAVEVGDRRWEGNARCNLGLLLRSLGRFDAARESLLSAARVAREIGFERLECFALGNLGLIEADDGSAESALTYHEEALAVARRIGDRGVEGQFLGYLGRLLGLLGRFDEARRSLTDGEAALDAVHDRQSLGLLLAQRAEVEWLAGEREAARSQARRADALARELGSAPESELGIQLKRVAACIDGSAAPLAANSDPGE